MLEEKFTVTANDMGLSSLRVSVLLTIRVFVTGFLHTAYACDTMLMEANSVSPLLALFFHHHVMRDTSVS